MFPKWSDWDFSYTKKGLMKQQAKQQAKQALQLCALVAVIVGLYTLRKDGEGFGALPRLIRQMVRSSLLTVDGWLRQVVSKV